MHLEPSQLEIAIFNLLRIMTIGGILIISFRGTNNEDNRESGKLYTQILVGEMVTTFSKHRAKILNYEREYESGRKLEWHNLVFRKLPHLVV